MVLERINNILDYIKKVKFNYFNFRYIFYNIFLVITALFLVIFILLITKNVQPATILFIITSICIFVLKIFYCFFLPLGTHTYVDPKTKIPQTSELSNSYKMIYEKGKNLNILTLLLVSNVFYKYSFFPFLPLIIFYSIFFLLIVSLNPKINNSYQVIIYSSIIISVIAIASLIFIIMYFQGEFKKQAKSFTTVLIFFTTITGRTILSLIGFTVIFTRFLPHIINSDINCSLDKIYTTISNIYPKIAEKMTGFDTENAFREEVCDNDLDFTTAGQVIIWILLAISFGYYVVAHLFLNKNSREEKDFFYRWLGNKNLTLSVIEYLSIPVTQENGGDAGNVTNKTNSTFTNPPRQDIGKVTYIPNLRTAIGGGSNQRRVSKNILQNGKKIKRK